MPLALLVAGIGTFLLIGIAGLSVIERYLIVPALALIVFAAVTFGGFSMLRPGTLVRRLWALGALALVLYGVLFTVTRVNVDRFRNELQFRGDAHAALDDVLRAPAVRAGLRCGPLTVPNHKLVPDSRWLTGLPFEKVRARAEKGVGAGPGARRAHLRPQPLRDLQERVHERRRPGGDPGPAGGRRAGGHNAYYAAYVRC